MTDNKTDAWMPLWIGAYLADTMRLTTVQHGAYLLLLIAYWRERAALPDDDEELRSITKMERAEWKRMRPVLAKFFKVEGGVWWHKRVEAEMAAADARSKAASSKAKKGAQARWKQPPGNAPSMPQALPGDMPKQCPTPSPLPNPTGYSVPDGTDGQAVEPKPITAADRRKSELWRSIKTLLVDSGESTSLKAAGAVVTKTINRYDEPTALAAIEATLAKRPAGVIAYLEGACQQASGLRQNKQEQLEAGNQAAAARFAETLQ